MDEILETVPLNFIPPTNTQAYALLAALSDGRPRHKGELIAVLGDDPTKTGLDQRKIWLLVDT